MVIQLPRAGPGSVGSGRRRARTVSLPTAGDVPTVRVAADPGLRVPDFTRFAGGLEDIGAGLAGLGEEFQRRQDALEKEAEKQRKRHEATQTGNTLLDLERFLTDDLRSRQTEDDPARPGFMTDYVRAGEAQLEKLIAGLDGVSEEATEVLRLKMRTALEGSTDAAGRLSLEAGKQAADDSAERAINQGRQQVERDPDFLDALLDELDERLEPFEGTSTADQERDRLQKARQEYILGAVSGLVRAGRFQDAELLLASGKFDDDLSRAQQTNANAMIDSGERQAVANAEKAETAAEKEIKEARDIRAAELTDGILEGRTTDAELDAALGNREIDGRQFIAVRKLLKAQEQEDALADDLNVVQAFSIELDDGTLTKDVVIDAFADKLITQATMNRFRNEIDAGPGDFRTKEQRRMLRENVGGVGGPLAIFDQAISRKMNLATQEFNERTRGPTAEDPLAVRRDIESRAAEPLEVESFFRPRFMVGVDKETMDVSATRKATLKAFREGRITREQVDRDIQLIKDIEAARARQ